MDCDLYAQARLSRPTFSIKMLPSTSVDVQCAVVLLHHLRKFSFIHQQAQHLPCSNYHQILPMTIEGSINQMIIKLLILFKTQDLLSLVLIGQRIQYILQFAEDSLIIILRIILSYMKSNEKYIKYLKYHIHKYVIIIVLIKMIN